MVWTNVLSKPALAFALAAGFLLLGNVTRARAADYDSCRRNVDKWEDRLERDIQRHGFDSRQANHDRHELAEARESCERHYGYGFRDHDDYNRDRGWR